MKLSLRIDAGVGTQGELRAGGLDHRRAGPLDRAGRGRVPEFQRY